MPKDSLTYIEKTIIEIVQSLNLEDYLIFKNVKIPKREFGVDVDFVTIPLLLLTKNGVIIFNELKTSETLVGSHRDEVWTIKNEENENIDVIENPLKKLTGSKVALVLPTSLQLFNVYGFLILDCKDHIGEVKSNNIINLKNIDTLKGRIKEELLYPLEYSQYDEVYSLLLKKGTLKVGSI